MRDRGGRGGYGKQDNGPGGAGRRNHRVVAIPRTRWVPVARVPLVGVLLLGVVLQQAGPQADTAALHQQHQRQGPGEQDPEALKAG